MAFKRRIGVCKMAAGRFGAGGEDQGGLDENGFLIEPEGGKKNGKIYRRK